MDEKTKKKWNGLVKGVHRTGGLGDIMNELALKAEAESEAGLRAENERLKEAYNAAAGRVIELLGDKITLKAEVERCEENYAEALHLASTYKESLEKAEADRNYWEREQANENRRWRQAEAELEKVKAEGHRLNGMVMEKVMKIVDLETELARWKPMIEAAEKLEFDAEDIRGGWYEWTIVGERTTY